jgi:Zn-finger nucleic acid-binding protein
MEPTTTILCPTCGGDMRTYERNSVAIDQCGDRRDIYLDRDELEQPLDAETRFQAFAANPAGTDLDRWDRRDRSLQPQRRRMGFFGDLFD